jgi:hypothetical protein
MNYGHFSSDDIEYTFDTLISLYRNKDIHTKEEVIESLRELLEDLDLLD